MEPFASRRRVLVERLDGAALLPAAPVAIRNNDVEHEYRQDSDLYYLTGCVEPEAALLLVPNHLEHRAVMFVRPRDAEREAWDGARLGVEGSVTALGVDAAYPITELAERLPGYLARHERLYHRLGRDRGIDDVVLAAIEKARARGRSVQAWPTAIVDPSVFVHEARLVKAEDEIAAMRRAAEITRDAHLAAMRLAAPGRMEHELDAAIREVFRREGCERWAYGPIVGSGPNATVLHYRKNARRMEAGELVLVDAGCEHAYYASDVTRTFPVSGAFSEAQRRLYEIVLEAEQASVEAVRPGATIDGVHEVAVRVIVAGLVRLGVLSGDVDALVAAQAHKPYFMHRTSHWLGMDVHDVGAYYVGGAPRPLAPGMVLTVEPGLYFRADDASVPTELRGLGVRIEDDVLVTSEGRRELTHDIPKAAADVERACRG
jgi:Xaa-Pro aminopeptidase